MKHLVDRLLHANEFNEAADLLRRAAGVGDNEAMYKTGRRPSRPSSSVARGG